MIDYYCSTTAVHFACWVLAEAETVSAGREHMFYADDPRCKPHGPSLTAVHLLFYDYCSYPRHLGINDLTTLPLDFFNGFGALVNL